MVFIRDVKSEFFNAIASHRVVVFASLDLDSVCATKILQVCLPFNVFIGWFMKYLQNLFFVEGVLYTIVPVLSLEEIESKFLEFSRGVRSLGWLAELSWNKLKLFSDQEFYFYQLRRNSWFSWNSPTSRRRGILYLRLASPNRRGQCFQRRSSKTSYQTRRYHFRHPLLRWHISWWSGWKR